MSRNVMFLNASMQGMYRGARVVYEGTPADRAKAAAVVTALVVAPEIYFYYINKDNKEYQALPDVVKQLNHVVPIGFEKLDESEACEFVSNITGDNSREVVSFGTEAGLFQEVGISTVVCGPGSIEQAHKIDEFIELNELKKCLKFLDGIKKKSLSD